MAKLAAAFDLAAEALREMEEPAPVGDALTIAYVAKALNVHRSHIYNLIKAGGMKALHIGKAVRIPQAELEAFKRRRTR
jgi:excisionase family DNA binding protein